MQLANLKMFSLSHTDAFVRGDRARDNSPMEELNFKVSFCNLKISTFMAGKDVPADSGEFRSKKTEALEAEREVRQKLLVLRQEKNRAQGNLEGVMRESILNRRKGRNAKFDKMFALLKKE